MEKFASREQDIPQSFNRDIGLQDMALCQAFKYSFGLFAIYGAYYRKHFSLFSRFDTLFCGADIFAYIFSTIAIDTNCHLSLVMFLLSITATLAGATSSSVLEVSKVRRSSHFSVVFFSIVV